MASTKLAKILYYFPEKKANMHQWQRVHFFDELAKNNISIEVFNPLHYTNLSQAQNALINLVKKNRFHYDLFFTGIGDNLISTDTIIEIKKTGLKTVLICLDNLHAPFMHKKLSPYFDLTWLTSSETENIFKKMGAKTIFLPYAANPYFFKPAHNTEMPTVGFIGTPYGTRLKKITQLTSHGIPVNIYSNSFFESTGHKQMETRTLQEKINHALNLLSFRIGRKILYSELVNFMQSSKDQSDELVENKFVSLHKSVPFNVMSELYSSFALSLGITDVRNTYLLKNPVLKLHLRTFEIPMSGGIQITNYTDELASYFEDGKEIILYKSDEELISKTKFYIKDSQAETRRKMKLAARKRAEAEHTWMNRFKKVFEVLDIGSK